MHKDSLYRTAIVMKVIKSDIQWKDTLKNDKYLKDSVKHQEVLKKHKFYQKTVA